MIEKGPVSDHPSTSDFWGRLREKMSGFTARETTTPAPPAAPETSSVPPVPLSDLQFEQFSYPTVPQSTPTTIEAKGESVPESTQPNQTEVSNDINAPQVTSDEALSASMDRGLRPSGNYDTSRQFTMAEVEQENMANVRHGDKVMVDFGDQKIECVFKDFARFDFSPSNPEVKWLIKTEPVKVTFAQGGEQIGTQQDGITPRSAEPGQVIIQNKPDAPKPEDPYIFGNDGLTVDQQVADFNAKYVPVENKPGYYMKKPKPMAVITMTEATAIKPSWDPNQLMATPAGGVVAEGGYTISPSSLAESYQFVPNPHQEPVGVLPDTFVPPSETAKQQTA